MPDLKQNKFVVIILLVCLAAACSRPASSIPATAPQTLPQDNGPSIVGTPEPPPSSPPTPTIQLALTDSSTSDPTTTTLNTPSPTVLAPATDLPVEHPVIQLPLDGPINTSQAEISGMDWYLDTLVLLPQYPERFGSDGEGAVFLLDKTDIQAYLEGESSATLQPRPIPFISSGLADRIPGYEGYEAIAFSGDRVYLTIESSPDDMVGYLVTGFVGGDLEWLSLDTSSLLPIQPQTDIPNLSDESIVIFGNRLVTVYEANGTAVNPAPVAHLFDTAPQPRDQLSFPNIEYRLTDATGVNDYGRFWMPNTFFIGDFQLMTADDPIAEQYGQGATHSQNIIVERLLEFQFSEQGIVLSDTPPIQLQLAEDGQTRNWEAIALLDEEGFLLATDEHPETIFAFVPLQP